MQAHSDDTHTKVVFTLQTHLDERRGERERERETHTSGFHMRLSGPEVRVLPRADAGQELQDDAGDRPKCCS